MADGDLTEAQLSESYDLGLKLGSRREAKAAANKAGLSGAHRQLFLSSYRKGKRMAIFRTRIPAPPTPEVAERIREEDRRRREVEEQTRRLKEASARRLERLMGEQEEERRRRRERR